MYGCSPSLASSRTTLTLYSISRRRGPQHTGFDARIHASSSTAQIGERKTPTDPPPPGLGFLLAHPVRIADEIRSGPDGHEPIAPFMRLGKGHIGRQGDEDEEKNVDQS